MIRKELENIVVPTGVFKVEQEATGASVTTANELPAGNSKVLTTDNVRKIFQELLATQDGNRNRNKNPNNRNYNSSRNNCKKNSNTNNSNININVPII